MCNTPHSPTRAPHKHAELIKAWADGAEIQDKEPGYGWCNSGPTPLWRVDKEYRIKPKTIKYRTYLHRFYNRLIVQTYNEEDSCTPEGSHGFVKWIGDWQEVEV